jgi:hypothetical protein
MVIFHSYVSLPEGNISSHRCTPPQLGLWHEKRNSEVDDWGYPDDAEGFFSYFRKDGHGLRFFKNPEIGW